MNTRNALCLFLVALCALHPAPALADVGAPTLAPAQLDQMLAERYGPLSYRPEAAADPADGSSLGAGAPLLTAASAGDTGASSTRLWIVLAVVVAIALVAGGGGGGGGY